MKRLQEKLGVKADGDFGPGTEKALKEFQASKGLVADGIAGPETFTAIGLPELVLLRKGLKGAQVKALQTALGVAADGNFGPGTEKAVKEFQTKNGLKADGMAGPATLAKTGAFPGVTAATVAAAALKPDEAHFEGEPLPEFKDNAVVAASAPAGKSAEQMAAEMNATIQGMVKPATAPEPVVEASIWGKVKGWF
ncbi:peptidoglycan-binding protein [Xinfangfangia sp. CPCC 101601]|uniref:Peptidoglycan-binding protein n=1 Tax=Pseudogemmobacter lacusdianii TaxID=3069608 RepID=A0ABU0W0H7_9RHOB|nr:peptidoglycan-binding protein [Xinfangfangia sp. CPCC 101601]MDQ2067516.1 peptidoglycan-binding protein [Xinfangfangia sp. CPCC 101601]